METEVNPSIKKACELLIEGASMLAECAEQSGAAVIHKAEEVLSETSGAVTRRLNLEARKAKILAERDTEKAAMDAHKEALRLKRIVRINYFDDNAVMINTLEACYLKYLKERQTEKSIKKSEREYTYGGTQHAFANAMNEILDKNISWKIYRKALYGVHIESEED